MSDPLSRGAVQFRQHGIGVELAVAHGVFSAATVDPGTRFLLRWLADRSDLAGARVLDLGCGYGPLAVWLAAAGAASVEAVDRDAVALEWTARNAAANGVGDRVSTTASVGYDDVGRGPFDLVVSNIPAKVGPVALGHLLLDAGPRLAVGGEVAVVVVARLAEAVRSVLEQAPAAHVSAEHANRTYLQVTYGLDPGSGDTSPGLARGVYDRARRDFGAGLTWTATTVRTLPEFDSLGHGTTAALQLIGTAGPSGPVTVVGVGQGHLAVGLALLGATTVTLVDRDLLALRVATANVAEAASGVAVDERHVARPVVEPDAALVVVALEEKEPVAVTAALLGPALGPLGAGSAVVLHGRAADVARVSELLPRYGARLTEVGRQRCHGHVAVRLRPRPAKPDTPPS